MSSLTSISSHARSKSLRSNTLKPLTTTNPSAQPLSGPPSITLFITNLRLLDLDLRDDWPDISAVTFSTKDAQQNQKKRIQCVEWALYQLFATWDPEETRNKLQPFFPPLEPLQSLNLRAALFRCLEHAKKIGVLSRDAVLRKTMLDECKGDKLEDVLAVFSNVVLKRKLQEQARHPDSIAGQLALESLSYSGERTTLSSLVLVHKASLRNHLHHKNNSRALYDDLSDLLALNERKLVWRQENLKILIEHEAGIGGISWEELDSMQGSVKKYWTGSDEWLEYLLYSDSRAQNEGLLGTPFETVWEHVESTQIGDIEEKQRTSLAEELDARIRAQEGRLARWQEFGRTIAKPGGTAPTKQGMEASPPSKIIDLAFSRHLGLQIGLPPSSDNTVRCTWMPLEDYTRLVENMINELADVEKPLKSSRLRQTFSPQSSPTAKVEPLVDDADWSSVSDSEEPSPVWSNQFPKSTPQTPPAENALATIHRVTSPSTETNDLYFSSNSITEEASVGPQTWISRMKEESAPAEIQRATVHELPSPKTHQLPSPTQESSISTSTKAVGNPGSRVSRNDRIGRVVEQAAPRQPRAPNPVIDPPAQSVESEIDLAEQILNSMSASSPSPRKTRHTLSLAERTRLSMARVSHSQYSDLHDDVNDLADLTRLSIRPKAAQPSRAPSEPEKKHADLIARTRKSMAGFEAAQKNAQIERRRSVKDAKKKQRESSYFPKVDEEPVPPGLDASELIDGDPDYETVFQSRPKIKTSPAVSPARVWMEAEEE